jgi:hypothetical protein
VVPVSLAVQRWFWLAPTVMEVVELVTSMISAMTLWSALVVREMVWAELEPLETKAWEPMGLMP